ncbi:hypothetical protein [Stieleria varia]|uniref:Uncharacterized protein n=1 Tax=Stieleria varia TaxID=2528005 RepID=A0A5C6B836_9BACT|nr:hypothetical protein [Stieleria varia]TWU08243.1 hypothetical protein Pla52n_08250 [Stieleria varia]
MKLVVAVVVLFVGGFVGINYGSKYILGGIEAGMPGGGEGKYAEYHEGNKFTSYLKNKKKRNKANYMPGKHSTLTFGSGTGGKTESGYKAPVVEAPGDISTNPFAK